jgi:hypothetical protein
VGGRGRQEPGKREREKERGGVRQSEIERQREGGWNKIN